MTAKLAETSGIVSLFMIADSCSGFRDDGFGSIRKMAQNSTSSSSSSSGSSFASATHCSIAGQTMMDLQ